VGFASGFHSEVGFLGSFGLVLYGAVVYNYLHFAVGMCSFYRYGAIIVIPFLHYPQHIFLRAN
jgi:hypothetical protein